MSVVPAELAKKAKRAPPVPPITSASRTNFIFLINGWTQQGYGFRTTNNRLVPLVDSNGNYIIVPTTSYYSVGYNDQYGNASYFMFDAGHSGDNNYKRWVSILNILEPGGTPAPDMATQLSNGQKLNFLGY